LLQHCAHETGVFITNVH